MLKSCLEGLKFTESSLLLDLDLNAEAHPTFKALVQADHFQIKAFEKQDQYTLSVKNGCLCVLSGNQKPIYVDFASQKIKSQISKTSRKSIISKALGLKQNQKHFIDLTAGFGKDAFVIAKYFSRVTLVERNPIVFLLLQDGLNRLSLQQPDLVSKFDLVFTDAESYLEQAENLMDSVVYFDFMFSDKRSKSNKEMSFLKFITKLDAPVNLENCLSLATSKIPVRTVLKAKAYSALKKPKQIYQGPTVSYYVFK